MKKKTKNPKCNNSMYISTKSPTVEIPAGIFRLAPVLWALILTGEDFLFSALTHLIFIPEAHGFKSCCEGVWIFHLNLKDSVGHVFPVPSLARGHLGPPALLCVPFGNSGILQEATSIQGHTWSPRWMSWQSKHISAVFWQQTLPSSARHCCCATWFWASRSSLLLSSFAVAAPSVTSWAQGLLELVFSISLDVRRVINAHEGQSHLQQV